MTSQIEDKELPPLQPGETVQMKHGEKWISAKVLHKHQSPGSYVIENEQRQKYRGNRVNCQRKNRGVMLNIQTPKSRA